MSGVPETTSDPGQASASTAPAAAGAGAPQAAQSNSTSGDEGAQPVPDSQQQAPKEAKEERPRPEWETAKDLEAYWETRKTFFTDEERTAAWERTAKIVETESDDMVERLNKEIDALLTYAGLFSAIQTAFNIELYKRLDPESDPDPVLVALQNISAQLNGFAVNPAFVNSTGSPFVISQYMPAAVPLWIVVVNALWFSSLISSLSAAFIGIMAKQWLTQYKAGVSGTERQTARLRQLRLNSLKRWRVEEIVGVVPVLLQLASGLFFAGLLVLLWSLNRPVAIVGSVFVGLLAVFALSTIILPSVVMHCSYLSPPSRVLFELIRPCRRALFPRWKRLSSWIMSHCGSDSAIFEYPDHCTAQREDFQSKHPHIYRFCLYLHDPASTLAWRGMESALVSRCGEELDGEMIETAYKTSMDTNYLRNAAVCTTELTRSVMRTCFQAIRSANIAHWGEDQHTGAMQSAHPCMWTSALVAFMTTSDEDPVWTPFALADALEAAYGYIRSWDQHVRSDASRTRLACVNIARVIQHCDDDTLPPNCKEIAGKLLRDDLPTLMDTKLGNDVRQYVASTSVKEALKELDRNTPHVSHAFYRTLRNMALCVPLPGSSDCTFKDPQYQEWRSHLSDTLSRLLSTPQSLEPRYAGHIDDQIFDWLREHGDSARLMSPELMRAIIIYLEAYETEHWTFLRNSWYEWIEELICKLAENSGKNAAVAVMESALRRTKGSLAVEAALLTEDDNLTRFRRALRRIIWCIPPLGSSECKPDDPVYKAVLERAIGALRTFSHFLPASLSRSPFEFMDVFLELEGHWKRAGLVSADLALAFIDCLEAYETTYGFFLIDTWYEWIEELICKLAENSGKNAAVAVMESALRRTKGPLSVDAASLTEDDNFIRFRHSLCCIIRCIPSPVPSNCIPDDPLYKAVLERAVGALRTFSHFLPASLSRSPFEIMDVFVGLEGHWKRAGLISADLALAIIDCLEAHETAYGYFWSHTWYEFIEELNRKLAASSGQNVVVAVMESALRRTDGPLTVDAAVLTKDDNLRRFCHALSCLIRCIPPSVSSDCNPDNLVYKVARERAVHALTTFSDSLPTSEPEEYPWGIMGVFDDLREHGERAGLMTTELRQAIVRYRDAYCSKYERDAWHWPRNEEWIQKLKRELDNSQQNAPASNARLLSEDTDSHPTTTHATPSVVQDVADTRTASPQAAGDDRGAHSAHMKTAVNQSSASTAPPSSGHAAAMMNGESTGSVVDKEDADRDTAEDERDTEEASGVKGSVSDTPPSPGGLAPA